MAYSITAPSLGGARNVHRYPGLVVENAKWKLGLTAGNLERTSEEG
jgi:hypothetical protein